MNVWGWLILFLAIFVTIVGLVSGYFTIHTFFELHQHPKIKQRPIIVSLVFMIGMFVLAGILTPISCAVGRASTATSKPSPTATNQTPTPIATPSVPVTSTLPSATAVPISPTASWLVYPTDYQFGAVVPDHEFKKQINPGQILSLSADVGQFTALDANNNPMTIKLFQKAGMSYVIILMGDQADSAPNALDVTGVSSGYVDWEIRTPPVGTPLLPAAVAVAERVGRGLMMKPNCGGPGCTTVGYYILDSVMHIKQSGEL